MPVPACQPILEFTAATDEGRGGAN